MYFKSFQNLFLSCNEKQHSSLIWGSLCANNTQKRIRCANIKPNLSALHLINSIQSNLISLGL